jgi:hypothetical protein
MTRSFWRGLVVIGLVAAGTNSALSQTPAESLAYRIPSDSDDGTETNRTYWHPWGYGGTNLNRMGRLGTQRYDTGLRFMVPDVEQGETFAFARLVLPATDYGTVESEVNLRVVGIDEDGVASYSVQRPSQWRKTAAVAWPHDHDWPVHAGNRPTPLWRHTPDLAAIINAIVGRSHWGTTAYGKTIGLVIEDDGSSGSNFLVIKDYNETTLYGTVSPVLELYRTVRSTFVAEELLGRPTDHSVTINAMSLLTLEAYVDYGWRPDRLTSHTPTDSYPGEIPIEITLDGLAPNTTYYYRLRFRTPGAPTYEAGPLGHFHTQRPPGSSFQFTVQSDSHIWEVARQGTDAALYNETLRNVTLDDPDFHIDLGDTLFAEDYTGGDVLDFEDAATRLLAQRPFLHPLCRSAPLFLVLGNHEGEQGWRLDGTPDNVAIWATDARKLLYPNPVPDDFYTGNEDDVPLVGQREDYYAFEWGDALFVVLDPYWYTVRSPHGAGGFPASGNNWDWTLGYTQYNWLRNVLISSDARFKFIFIHQLVGGNDIYGRGGIEAIKHALGGFGSFEWGGEDPSGVYAFPRRRLGWGQPIHRLMVDNAVTIVFHGHDHVFVKQQLDGVVYQETPQPSDRMYSTGLFIYLYGDRVANSGYLRVTVGPTRVRVEYVRTYLPEDGTSGEVAYSYEIPAPEP